MILQNDRAHAMRLRLARRLERVERSRAIVGIAVDVNVDRPGQQARVLGRIAALAGTRSRDDDHEQHDERGVLTLKHPAHSLMAS